MPEVVQTEKSAAAQKRFDLEVSTLQAGGPDLTKVVVPGGKSMTHAPKILPSGGIGIGDA